MTKIGPGLKIIDVYISIEHDRNRDPMRIWILIQFNLKSESLTTLEYGGTFNTVL